jgi:hypothetical protein
MHDEKLNKAREIFLHYSGSYFQMEREGVLQDYRKYGISKQQELEWIKEYQQELVADIKKENVVGQSFVFLVHTICEYRDIEGMNIVVKLIERKKGTADSFTQLRIAESLIRIYDCFREYNVLPGLELGRLKKLAIEILKAVLAGPITVAEYYRKKIPREFIRDDEVIARAKKDLEEVMRE